MIIRTQIQVLATLLHLGEELLVSHGYPNTQVDKHIGHRAIARTLPVSGIWHIRVGFCVVHITHNVQDRTRG